MKTLQRALVPVVTLVLCAGFVASVWASLNGVATAYAELFNGLASRIFFWVLLLLTLVAIVARQLEPEKDDFES